ncbi:hypothetical protein HPB47_013523 [Ixodes persulcatus]|uniref:Uncharacterized protein n=1 Tax=Ixodes persulcatus TaxID=34615 RepID=A0AC60QYL5_IXOPE|nr:hypothetical protein HPB47_013523 [Ixodes persulcatus]
MDLLHTQFSAGRAVSNHLLQEHARKLTVQIHVGNFEASKHYLALWKFRFKVSMRPSGQATLPANPTFASSTQALSSWTDGRTPCNSCGHKKLVALVVLKEPTRRIPPKALLDTALASFKHGDISTHLNGFEDGESNHRLVFLSSEQTMGSKFRRRIVDEALPLYFDNHSGVSFDGFNNDA